ncbi:nicotinate-nucleotide pyrophosphorylase [Candidatus Magnetoovum chiemensis]|nr:nicotinate-nucleotide pyrophosphorylase [Candidatus Magnetoovum chiemensis]
MIPNHVIKFIETALDEDIGSGDITTELTVAKTLNVKAQAIAKEDFVLAGMPFSRKVYELITPSVEITVFKNEGERVRTKDVICEINAPANVILSGERLFLNILQRLSGIATITRRFVDEVDGLPVKITDTRKTTPNMRYMEKYAVRQGGGSNHRFGLSDGVLIKDNHIKAAGGVKEAIRRIKNIPLLTKIEVEVSNIAQLLEALNEDSVDVIMLDNMPLEEMTEAVNITRSKRNVLLEASGNVTIENARAIASCGIDIISTGLITHSAKASDISLKITQGNPASRQA